MAGFGIRTQLGGHDNGTHEETGEPASVSDLVCGDGQAVKVFQGLTKLFKVSPDEAPPAVQFPTPQNATASFLLKVGIEPATYASWTACYTPLDDWDLAIETFVQCRQSKLPRRRRMTINCLIEDLQTLGLTKTVAAELATTFAEPGSGHYPLDLVAQEFLKSAVMNEYCENFPVEREKVVFQDADGNFVV